MEVWSSIIDTFRKVEEDLSAIQVSIRWPDGNRQLRVKAIPPMRDSETENAAGVVIETKLRWFSFRYADLDQEPVRNMEITWGTQVYRATHPSGSMVWDWEDHYQRICRVATEMIPSTVMTTGPYGTPTNEAYGDPSEQAYGTPD